MTANGSSQIHVEVFDVDGHVLRVSCDCQIGRMHSYSEWQDRYGHAPLSDE